jgi:hypothetical protein
MRIFSASIVCVLFATSSHALPITFTANGTIEAVHQELINIVNMPLGDVFTLTFTVDPDTAVAESTGTFIAQSAPLSVTGSNYSFSSPGMRFSFGPDEINTTMAGGLPSSTTASPFPIALLQGTGIWLTHAGPSAAFDFPADNGWRMLLWLVDYRSLDEGGVDDIVSFFDLTNVSVTTASVPEPATWMLLAGGAAILLKRRSRA